MSKSSNTVIGLLAGTVIGATLGILFAPAKGKKTRKKITDEALIAKDKLKETATDLKSKASSKVSSKKETLEAQLEDVVSNVSHKAEDVITTLEKKLEELKEQNKKLQKEG